MSSELPPGLARLWDTEERPPRRTLSVDGIVEAAIALADEEGLEAVSMGRVAKALGVTPMSLYRHVENKDELLALMLDRAAGEAPADTAGDWRARTERWCRELRVAIGRHPWILNLPLSRAPLGPRRTAWMEAGFAALSDTPLSEADKAATVLTLNGLIISDLRFGREAAMAAPADADAFARTVAAVAGDRFPALSRAMAAGIFGDEDDPDAVFAYGLERLLDGVEAQLRSGG